MLQLGMEEDDNQLDVMMAQVKVQTLKVSGLHGSITMH